MAFQNLAHGACSKAANSQRIVAAGGSITEIIYLLGFEKQLIARDLTSNFPNEALDLPSIGYVRNLSAEGMLSLQPTLIIGEADVGPAEVVSQVKRTSIDFRIIPDFFSTDGIFKKIRCVGKILGVQSSILTDRIQRLNKLKTELQSEVKNNAKQKILLILMMRGTSPIVGGLDTSGDGFIRMTGNLNAFSKFKGWKPVGLESIIASDPDYIIITNRAFSQFKTVSKFFELTKLGGTAAGKNKNLIIADGMAILGFSPRTLEMAVKLSKQINSK